MLEQFFKFCREAYQELKLASWLSRKEMAGSTVVVIILTLLVAAYVALIDQALMRAAHILFRIG